MDEMKKDGGMAANCSCPACMRGGMCHYCGGRRFWLLRWLLGLAVLAIAFALGVKIGEFKSSFYGYGDFNSYGMHRNMMWGYQQQGWPYPMMVPYNLSTQAPATTAPTATSTKK